MVALSAVCKKNDDEDFFREAFRLQEKVLGPDHPDTLLTANSLAIGLTRLGRLEEAEEVALPALQGKEKALGSEHPWTLEAANTLATIYRA